MAMGYRYRKPTELRYRWAELLELAAAGVDDDSDDDEEVTKYHS